MLDQLIASKGRVFFGTWWSTLSGYVNRMRGYYIAKHKLDGHKDGTMESYYFYPVSDCVLLRDAFLANRTRRHLRLYRFRFPISIEGETQSNETIHAREKAHVSPV